jgi:hypothetical protein
MKKLKLYLVGVALLATLPFAIIAQPLVQQALTGNEAVLVQGGGPGGPGAFTTVAALRNGLNTQLVPTGGTVNTTILDQTGVLIAQGAIATWNIQMPKAPYDGQTVRVNCPGGTATAIVVTYTPATLVGTALTDCTAGTEGEGAEWVYASTPNVWYRLQ